MLTNRSSARLEPADLTDAAAAEKFAEEHHARLRYCAAQKSWYYWAESHWEPDTSLQAQELARQWSLSLWNWMTQPQSPEEQQALKRAISRRQSAAAIRGLLECARSDEKLSIRPEDWNQSPWLLNVANGTLDLRRRELRSHLQTDLFNLAAPVKFDPEADCPQFKTFITQIMGGDQELVRYLQQAIGYMLTGESTEQCMFVFLGSGANGKSTLLETIRVLFGAYARQANFDTFLQQWSSRVRQDIARLQGARLVTASEANAGAAFDEALLKQLSGSDVVTSRFLFKGEVEYKPQYKIVLACNHLPRITGTDDGIWRRIRVVPFPVRFADADQDRSLGRRLRNELSGILNWALLGCRDWLQEGLKPPRAVLEATAAYRSEMDSFPAFFEDCCESVPGGETLTHDILIAYRRWSEERGLAPRSDTWLGKRLSALGIGRCNRNGASRRIGIRLRNTPT